MFEFYTPLDNNSHYRYPQSLNQVYKCNDVIDSSLFNGTSQSSSYPFLREINQSVNIVKYEFNAITYKIYFGNELFLIDCIQLDRKYIFCL